MFKNKSPYHSYTYKKILISKVATGGIFFKREKGKKIEAGKVRSWVMSNKYSFLLCLRITDREPPPPPAKFMSYGTDEQNN